MKITLIGGSGFVGTKFLERYLFDQKPYTFCNLDKRQSIKFPEISQIVNILDKDKLEKALVGTDVVILLAAEHRDDVTPTSLYYEVNVEGMKNTLSAMEANGIQRLIFTSSVAVYGLDKDNPDESFPAEPFNHYGKSKWEAEQVLESWYQKHKDWSINIVRPTVIFGEGNRGNVFNLLNQIANGKFMMIGNGKNEKSMSYIGNIIAFLEFLITKNGAGYHIYNYVDKPDFTTKDLVFHTGHILNKQIPTTQIPYWLGMLGGYGFDFLAFLSRKKLNISSVRVKKFCAVTKYDSTKAMKSGFIPPYTMEEGLRRMLEEEFNSQEQ